MKPNSPSLTLCWTYRQNVYKKAELVDKNEFGYIGKLDGFSFDHTISMQLRWDVSEISCPDTVTGVITFPYFNHWEEIKNWIDKVPEDNYSVYIINPI